MKNYAEIRRQYLISKANRPPPQNYRYSLAPVSSASNLSRSISENVDLRNPALPNGAPRPFNKMGPSIVGPNSGGSLRGISLGERRNATPNVLPTGGLTSVFGDNAADAAMGSTGTGINEMGDSGGVQQDDSAALGYRNTTQINPGQILFSLMAMLGSYYAQCLQEVNRIMHCEVKNQGQNFSKRNADFLKSV